MAPTQLNFKQIKNAPKQTPLSQQHTKHPKQTRTANLSRLQHTINSNGHKLTSFNTISQRFQNKLKVFKPNCEFIIIIFLYFFGSSCTIRFLRRYAAPVCIGPVWLPCSGVISRSPRVWLCDLHVGGCANFDREQPPEFEFANRTGHSLGPMGVLGDHPLDLVFLKVPEFESTVWLCLWFYMVGVGLRFRFLGLGCQWSFQFCT